MDLKGIVVFFEPDYATHTLKETLRTSSLPASDALYLYANTKNPASQVYFFSSEEQRNRQEDILQAQIVDPVWLGELFECI